MAALSLAFDILARDRASAEFDKVGDAAETAGRKGSTFGPALGAGLAVAGVAAFKFGADSVAAFKESEDASARLDDALARFPATNDVTRASFDQLNSALAQKTTFDDDATASGQAVLAQFKLTGSQIQELTPLLQDYAAKTGKDLPEAAEVLGKALLGKGKALSEVGVKFKDAGSVEENYSQITKGLRDQVGGFAEHEGKTAAGQAAILGNQFGEVQETVGSKLVPILTTLTGKLLEVIGFVQRNSAVIGPLVVVLGGVAAVVWTIITAQRAWVAVQKALDIVLIDNPIGLVVAAIALLVAGVVLAYRHSETFRDMVNSLWGFLRKFVGFTPLGALIENFDKVRAAVGWVVDKVEDLIHALGRIKMPKLDLPGGGLLKKLPGFASGVTNFSGGMALVGEEGPELAYLPPGTSVLPAAETAKALTRGAGAGDTYTIVVPPAADPQAAARSVVLALRMA